MRVNFRFRRAVVLAAMAMVLAAPAVAQAVKVAQRGPRVSIGAGVLSVSVAPPLLNFNLVAKGAAVGNSPVSITTTSSGLAGSGTVSLYAYFTSSIAALTGLHSNAAIPSSDVLGQMTSGLPTSYTPFTQTNPLGTPGASLKLFSQSFVPGAGVNRTDALSMKIDLTTLPALLPDTYTGTLTIQVQEL